LQVEQAFNIGEGGHDATLTSFNRSRGLSVPLRKFGVPRPQDPAPASTITAKTNHRVNCQPNGIRNPLAAPWLSRSRTTAASCRSSIEAAGGDAMTNRKVVSKGRHGAILAFSSSGDAFIDAAKAGEFDL
jgi:hypothetical protein